MKISVEICTGPHCVLMGALNLGVRLEDMILEMQDEVSIKYVRCEDNCGGVKAPVVRVNGEAVPLASVEKVLKRISAAIATEKQTWH